MTEDPPAPPPPDAPPRRVTSNPNRPALSPEAEARMQPIDEKSAQAYDLIEAGVERLDELLGSGEVQIALDTTETAIHRIVVKPPPPEGKPG